MGNVDVTKTMIFVCGFELQKIAVNAKENLKKINSQIIVCVVNACNYIC